MEGEEEAAVAVSDTSGHSHAWAACVDMAPQRAAPGVGVLGAGGTAGARRGAWLLVGDEPQGTRTFPNGAALLSGPPRSPLFAEACVGAGAAGG